MQLIPKNTQTTSGHCAAHLLAHEFRLPAAIVGHITARRDLRPIGNDQVELGGVFDNRPGPDPDPLPQLDFTGLFQLRMALDPSTVTPSGNR